jgi:hypothetical protein
VALVEVLLVAVGFVSALLLALLVRGVSGYRPPAGKPVLGHPRSSSDVEELIDRKLETFRIEFQDLLDRVEHLYDRSRL